MDFKRTAQMKFTFVHRKKNMESLYQLGVTIDDVKNEIFKLTLRNYISGPSKDKDRAIGNMWIFGTAINDFEIYIKLSDNFNYSIAKCISFHKADFRCDYPYKENN